MRNILSAVDPRIIPCNACCLAVSCSERALIAMRLMQVTRVTHRTL